MFFDRVSTSRKARTSGPGRRRVPTSRPVLEALESRELLSLGSARSEDWLTAAAAKVKTPVLPVMVLSPPSSDGTMVVGGKTKAKAVVQLDLGANGSIEQKVKSDAKGKYKFTIRVDYGTTSIRVLGPGKGRTQPKGQLSVLRPDATPPVVTLTGSPPPTLTRSDIVIDARATDVGSGVSQVTFQIDDRAPVNLSFGDTGGFRLTITAAQDGRSDGSHVVRFRATDRLGNVSAPLEFHVVVDTTAPTAPNFDLAPASDTGTPGDSQTSSTTVGLVGTTEPGATVRLGESGPSTVAGSDGRFTLSGVVLNVGSNALTLQAFDALGNTSSASRTITRQSFGTFGVDTPRVVVGTPEQLIFRYIPSGTTSNPSIKLYDSDASGTRGAFLLDMLDNGDFLIGDLTANDGVYSNTFSIQSNAPGDRYFVARIEGQPDTLLSTKVTAVARPTDQRLNSLLDQQTTLDTQLGNALAAGQEPAAALAGIRQALLTRTDLVDPSSVVVNSSGIAWRSNEGLGSVLLVNSYQGDFKGGPNSGETGADDSGSTGNSIPPITAVEPMPEELCGTALVISPYAWDFEPNDESDEIAEALREKGVLPVIWANHEEESEEVTTGAFKNLSKYSEIVISTHGGVFEGYGVVLGTGVKISLTHTINVEDWILGRLLKVGGNTFGITPSFINRYAGKMDKTIVYVSACSSAADSSMADAFLSHGAAAYIGYSDSVNSGFSFVRGGRTFGHLIGGGTVGTIPGINVDRSPVAPNAMFRMFAPDPSAKLPAPCGIDQLFIQYSWAASQRDLDTGTTFLGTSVGYRLGSSTTYLDWSGDDTSNGGRERILVDLDQSHEDEKWTDTIGIALAAGWYEPSHGSGPATLTIGFRNKSTGEIKKLQQFSILVGQQSGAATFSVGRIDVTLTGEPGHETVDYLFTP